MGVYYSTASLWVVKSTASAHYRQRTWAGYNLDVSSPWELYTWICTMSICMHRKRRRKKKKQLLAERSTECWGNLWSLFSLPFPWWKSLHFRGRKPNSYYPAVCWLFTIHPWRETNHNKPAGLVSSHSAESSAVSVIFFQKIINMHRRRCQSTVIIRLQKRAVSAE